MHLNLRAFELYGKKKKKKETGKLLKYISDETNFINL